MTADPIIPEYDITWLENAIHDITNVERHNNKRKKLEYDEKIAEIARKHSADMVTRNFFSHDNPDGQTPTDRAHDAGLRQGIAENIAQHHVKSFYENGDLARYNMGEEIAESVVLAWMDSPGHRANLLNSAYDREGIGVAIAANGYVLITQNFCSKKETRLISYPALLIIIGMIAAGLLIGFVDYMIT